MIHRFRVFKLLLGPRYLCTLRSQSRTLPPMYLNSQHENKKQFNTWIPSAIAAICAILIPLVNNKNNDAVCDSNAKIDHILDEIDELFREEKDAAHIPGMVYGIMKEGKLIHAVARGYADVERGLLVDLNTRFRIASMSKSFTAMAILKLRDEGKLSLEDPVTKHIPDLILNSPIPPTSLTVRHLLIHAGGLPQEDPWADRLLDMSSLNFKSLMAKGVSMSNVPGEAFEYSNLGYAMLGQIIQSSSGEGYQQYITNNILKPLDMLDTTYEIDMVPSGKFAFGYRYEGGQWVREEILHDGAFGAMGGITTTLADFSKYVNYHMSAWSEVDLMRSSSKYPLSTSSLREMHIASILDAVIMEPTTAVGVRSASSVPTSAYANCYGFGFRISKFNDGTILVGHAGGLPGYGCDFRFLSTHKGLAVISFTNRTYGAMPKVNLSVIKRILKEIKKDPIDVSLILKQRTIELKRILLESCVLPSKDMKYTYQYDSIWSNKNRDCFSSNFFMDQSVLYRIKDFNNVLFELGGYISHFTSSLVPINKLRGSFHMVGINGREAMISFTLTPENIPKIQHLTMTVLPLKSSTSK